MSIDASRPTVLVGSSIPPGLGQLDTHCRLKLGDIVLTALPRTVDEAVAVAAACRDRGIYVCFSEICFRGTDIPCKCWGEQVERTDFFSRADLARIAEAAGDYYFGRYAVGEIGGILYWPKDQFRPPRPRAYQALPECGNQQEARDLYVETCRSLIERDRELYGAGPLINVESSLLFKYQAEAGLDKLCLEVMPGDPILMHSAIRGASRAANLPWGVHIAMGWYGGVTPDRLFEQRWRASLGWSYICGAEFIFPESGHYTYENPYRGISLDFHDETMVRMRRTLRETVQFARIHRRPEGGPKVRLGLLHGNLDGAPGLWNPYAWGQVHSPEWHEGHAERGWRLVETLFRREQWTNPRVQGHTDWSGNPPSGQVDIVPAEADGDVLATYSCLLCPAWNTMTPELYAKLHDYVAGGGRLILFLPQLGTQTGRAEPIRLIHDGDLSDLFGVRITGRADTDVRGVRFLEQPSIPGYSLPVYKELQDPVFLGNFTPATVEMCGARVLAGTARRFTDDAATVRSRPLIVEHRVGRGTAMLVLAWNWPADPALSDLTVDLLRTVAAGEQRALKVAGSDQVRYAVYDLEGSDAQILYLLNTDPDADACVRIGIGDALSPQIRVPCGKLTPTYVLGDVIVAPGDNRIDMTEWEIADSQVSCRCFTACAQTATIWSATPGARVTLNDRTAGTEPDRWVEVTVPRTPDPARPDVFAPDFLDEPDVDYQDAPLPY
jgi:hypothetical protein